MSPDIQQVLRYTADPYLSAMNKLMGGFSERRDYIPLPVRVEMHKRAPTPKPSKLKKKKRGY